ncbi:cation efflux system protein [Sulfuriferula plumbiphila]|uniref:Cation efflux system protein n=1 Tax=Sulfuriferula plumbiphila TaxID=171865 RepID=A0A512L532_9PROT|nr:efflux RND transporter permease subunit [Sulfuriferula plumbiphila]BBP05801.1 cation efflux system protein [Sulfuriferula plumbiphila]GEP29570.1 cation efflux system protein [Sulfuriferula plumbiphila]
MLTPVVRFAIRFRGVVIALAMLLAGYGLFALSHARLDVFPEFAPPQVQVQTEAPGLSPAQVEVLVTQPLENRLAGLTGIKTLRSRSFQGLSMITLTFAPDTDIYRDRQVVAEQMGGTAGTLPRGVKAPALLPLASSTSVVLSLGLTSKSRSLMELRTLADWSVKPQLLAVGGVAGISVFGGEVKQLQIQIAPARLVRYGLAIQDVVNAAKRATAVRGAGLIENNNQRITLETTGQPLSAAALGAVVLRNQGGATLRLADVANVTVAPAPAVGAASIEGQPGVMLVVEEQYGANTLAVTRALEQRLAQLKPALAAEGVTLHPDLFRPANFIETAISHLRTALLIGAALVLVVLFLFLFNVRAAVISASAIPLSLLTAVIVLNHFGIGLNTMTLGGLAIAIGEVVDDAIVDVENIFRRLRENRLLAAPLGAAQVVLNASLEVRGAVIYATFIVALVFVPVLTLSGVAGSLFGPLALAYIAAIMASLVVALTLTPALACALLARRAAEADEPPLGKWLKARYTRLLADIDRRAGAAILVVVLLCGTALAVLPFMQGSFLPTLREGHFIVHMKMAPGTSLPQSLALGQRVSGALSRIPGIRSVAQRAGRATQVSDPAGAFSSEFEVDLAPLSGAGQQRVLNAIRSAVVHFVGASFSVNTFLTERIHETISGYTAPLVVNVYGNDLDVLDRKAEEIAAAIRGVAGAGAVQVQAPTGSPQLVIHLHDGALSRLGIAPVDALSTVETAYAGRLVGEVYEGNRVFDVAVVLAPRLRQSPAQVGELPLKTPDGRMVQLRDVADITQTDGRYLILHDDAQRLQVVTAEVKGRALSSFVNAVKKRIAAQVTLPRGTYLVFAGDAPEQARAQQDLLLHSALAAAGVALLLYMALGGVRSAILVFANLPFALAGGVAMVLVTGGVLSIGSLVGFVTLFGITLRNAIMLISHYRHLVEVEGVPWDKAAAIRGAAERLSPILMTALVTALGLLPLALTSGAPGNEIEGPMAAVILGGLITSTLLNLLVLPTLALRYGRFGRPAQRDAPEAASASSSP